MLTLVKSVDTRRAGAKGSHVGSKGRLDGLTVGGFECWHIHRENRALLFLPQMHSHSGNYMVFYESIQYMTLSHLQVLTSTRENNNP